MIDHKWGNSCFITLFMDGFPPSKDAELARKVAPRACLLRSWNSRAGASTRALALPSSLQHSRKNHLNTGCTPAPNASAIVMKAGDLERLPLVRQTPSAWIRKYGYRRPERSSSQSSARTGHARAETACTAGTTRFSTAVHIRRSPPRLPAIRRVR
jgi:hypothetical protein